MNPARSLMTRYRLVLGVVAVTLVFSNAWLFLYDQALNPVPPSFLGAALLALGAPLLFHYRTTIVLAHLPLLWWGAGYALVTVFSFFWSSQSDVAIQELVTRFFWLALLFIHVIILADSAIHRTLRALVVVVVLLASALNYWDLMHPGVLSLSLGRATGLYGNPNIAAQTLTLGMIASIEAIPVRWRGWYAVIVAAGILPTFSRGGIMVWLLVVMMFLWSRTITIKHFVRAFVLVVLIGGAGFMVFAGPSRLTALVQMNRALTNQLARVGATGLGTRLSDPSVNERSAVLDKGLEVVAEHPLIGAGLAAAIEWSEDASTHNIYLLHMVELGPLGIMVYPLFLLSLICGSHGRPRKQTAILAACLGLWGLLSHNLVDQWVILLPVSLLAVESALCRYEHSDRFNHSMARSSQG